MKPSFALSLSYDGILLLHRGAGGWRSMGEVDPAGPDLTAAMAELLERAKGLSSDPIATKLILPNDQIRYLTVTIDPAEADAMDQIVRDALDGTTPYDVADLVYDTCPDGEEIHVAAVARETLMEAEGFAIEHGFNPVSFVSVPGDMPFLGEPFFGMTAHAKFILPPNDPVEPDGIAVVITGEWEPETTAPPEEPTETVAEDIPPAPVFGSRRSPRKADETTETDIAPEPAEETPPVVGFAGRRAQSTEDAAPDNADPVVAHEDVAPEPASDVPPEPADQFPEEVPAEAPLADDAWVAEQIAPSASIDASGGRADAPIEAVPELPNPAIAATLRAPRAEPDPAPPAKSGARAFLKRRLAKPAVTAAPGPFVSEVQDESQRLTVFGERTAAVRGKPRHLGLILTTILLIFLAAVAAWATFFLPNGLAYFLSVPEDTDLAAEPEIDVPETDPIQTAVTLPPELGVAPTAEDSSGFGTDAQLASLPQSPELTDTDGAVLDALREPVEALPEVEDAELSDAELEAQYAATGIWPQAPEPLLSPGIGALDDFYVTSIDGETAVFDAVALAPVDSYETDIVLAAVASPAAAGIAFDLNELGLVRPTVDGALSPDGHRVYLGRPDVVPPPTPVRLELPEETEVLQAEIGTMRPQSRPSDFSEQSERARLGGLNREELAAIRPQLRPTTEKEVEEVKRTFRPPTEQAVSASKVPLARPKDLVARAEKAAASAPAAVAAIAPKTVKPAAPSSASVARQATIDNAINLKRVNLIGVYGTPSARRALVRLPSGRYKKVQIGDRVDGGRVVAIGESELRYHKNGRNMTLKMPRG